ncbi:MAG: hypothetical protein ACR2QK_02630 [Acidimicrobiales bacterium]
MTTGFPLEEVAAAVNTESALRDRVESCQAELGRQPNVIAVDFAEAGDLVEFVAELNGVGEG